MFRHELSTFLREVLDEIGALPNGMSVDASGEPDARTVAAIAARIHARPEDVRQAMVGLRASQCLTECWLEIDGIVPIGSWSVHPQCRV